MAQSNICASIVFKTLTNQKYEEQFFLSFLFQNSKIHYFGGHQIKKKMFFFSFSFLNNRYTNVLLGSSFEKA